MKRARAVIGASFGDEGKGLVTDFLCATQGAGSVVRFNGGAQAGHTVVTPEGQRHVFSHVGSGTFCGVPTYLSRFFVVNPILLLQELVNLEKLGIFPWLYAHPECLVTTFADMMINQTLEQQRGEKRHGSVGVGVNETVMRSSLVNLKITMGDLWNRSPRLEQQIVEICTRYSEWRTGKKIEGFEMLAAAFLKQCEMVAKVIQPSGIEQCEDPVFEGAQGLLLDQDNKEHFPHVTRSKTGMHNVRILCEQAGIDHIEAIYVSRTYLTRHGAGKLPGEDSLMSFPDDTNVAHPFQGPLRFAPLDTASLRQRVEADAGPDIPHGVVFTHCDQLAPPADIVAMHYSYGPSRIDVQPRRKV